MELTVDNEVFKKENKDEIIKFKEAEQKRLTDDVNKLTYGKINKVNFVDAKN